MYVLRNVVRSGQRDRDFNSPVYRIRDNESNRDYYFAAEFANTLASLSDIWRSGLRAFKLSPLFGIIFAKYAVYFLLL